MSTRLNININDESGQPIMGDHEHPDGLFCDDCPDALRRNIKRILIQHQWTNDYYDRNCDCGWSMPFKEEQQFAAHLADVLSAALTDLGWVRAAPLQADRDALAAKVAGTIAGVRAWCAINEIAEPPLDWVGLDEFLDRAEGA